MDTCHPMSRHEIINKILADTYIANANVFACYKGAVATIMALGNTRRALAIVDELMASEPIDMH